MNNIEIINKTKTNLENRADSEAFLLRRSRDSSTTVLHMVNYDQTTFRDISWDSFIH